MIIYLFRHGETDWNKARRLQGQSDVPLNEFGRELAVKTAAALKDVSFDAAFSSPLDRAMETAKTLLGDRDVPLVADDRLREFNFGAGEGERFDVMKSDASHPLHNFFCHPESYVPQGQAESFQEVTARGRAFFEERILPLEDECGKVLVVAHGAFNRCILSDIAGLPLQDFWTIGLPNCAASILKLENGKLEILDESVVYYGKPVNVRP